MKLSNWINLWMKISLDGFVLGLGYNRDLDNGAFVRVEASYMDLMVQL